MGQDVYRTVYDKDSVGYYPDIKCEINFKFDGAHSYTLTYADSTDEITYTTTEDASLITFTPWDFGTVMIVTRDYYGNCVKNMTLYIVPLDSDNDGVWDHEDNCFWTYNPDQKDLDEDGMGDACDNDWDGDGIQNKGDNCPWTYNPDQKDLDEDGMGDACDNDRDGDGIQNREDNCPWTYNPDQKDLDEDGIGNECDNDWDNDGIKNKEDNCLWTYNPDQKDLDEDGIGDACDNDYSPCGECDGQVTQLTLKYLGKDKAYIKIVQHLGLPVYHGWVKPGDVFTIYGKRQNGTFGPKVYVFLNCHFHTMLHTSCSQPIGPGLVKGSFLVVKGRSQHGGNLCPICNPCQ